MQPKSTKFTSVSDLSRASELIFSQVLANASEDESKDPKPSELEMITIPHEIIKDLDESIELRSTVGKILVENNNDGHPYMLKTLKDCRKKLKQAMFVLKINRKSSAHYVNDTANNGHQHHNEQKSNSNN